jgi:hypothetical protein
MTSAAALVSTSHAQIATHTLHAWQRHLIHSLASRVRMHVANQTHEHSLLRRSLLSLRGNVEACRFERERETVLFMRSCMRAMHAWRASVADSLMRNRCAASLGDARKQRQEAQTLQQCLYGLRRWAEIQRACRFSLCRV